MQVHYEQTLVEECVFRATRADPALEREMHAALDPIYALRKKSNGESDAQFQNVFSAFFARLKLDGVIVDLLAEQPQIAESVSRCIVSQAERQRAESAELFSKKQDVTHRTLMIRITPDSLISPNRAAGHLRRELFHVADMVNDTFAYRPDQIDEINPRRNLILDRYRVYWDIYIEGRLYRRQQGDPRAMNRLRHALPRTLGVDYTDHSRAIFDQLFTARQLTHQQLLSWARQPQQCGCASATSVGHPKEN